MDDFWDILCRNLARWDAGCASWLPMCQAGAVPHKKSRKGDCALVNQLKVIITN